MTALVEVEVKRRYDRERQRAIAAGTWAGRVRPDECVEHVARLRADGMSARSIAAAAGVSLATVAALAWPEHHSATRRWVTASTAAAVLSVTDPRRVDARGMVLAVGTQRRLQALACLGWSVRRSMAMAHLDAHDVMRRTRVRKATADAVARLYDALSMTPGPSLTARTLAARRGWLPPLAWDDELIDVPWASPSLGDEDLDTGDVDEVAVGRAMCGERVVLTRTERRVAVERLAGRGVSDRGIADLLGVTGETVARDRRVLDVQNRWSA